VIVTESAKNVCDTAADNHMPRRRHVDQEVFYLIN